VGRPEFDVVLVGGGLQSALIALALRARQPQCRWALVEREATLGGNHTWCFHQGDVDDDVRAWIEPLVVHRWSGYDVRFPGFARRIERAYAAITSERLHEVVTGAGGDVRLDAVATALESSRVTLQDGTILTAQVVIDARGPEPEPARHAGFQKFLGWEVELAGPHGLTQPVLMDATVDQRDGFRFVYVLPFSATRVLAEDTYFSHEPRLDEPLLRQRIGTYLDHRGWTIQRVIREEKGILPMPWREHSIAPGQGPLRAGYRGGFFHPGTGYSLPVAARLAGWIADRPADRLLDDFAGFVRDHRRRIRFCHLLNHMLFRWFPPSQRWHVFRRFYGLPLPTIERFYALDLRAIDRARLVMGRPPRGISLRYRLAKEDRR
jgi:lycopene beta-cyclase